MVLKLNNQIINLSNEEPILCVSVVLHNKVSLIPKLRDFLDIIKDGGFTTGLSRDLLDSFEVILNACFNQLVQVEIEQGAWRTTDELPNVVPMLLLHGWITKGTNEVLLLGHSLDFSFHCIKYFIFFIKSGADLDQL